MLQNVMLHMYIVVDDCSGSDLTDLLEPIIDTTVSVTVTTP